MFYRSKHARRINWSAIISCTVSFVLLTYTGTLWLTCQI